METIKIHIPILTLYQKQYTHLSSYHLKIQEQPNTRD